MLYHHPFVVLAYFFLRVFVVLAYMHNVFVALSIVLYVSAQTG